MAVFYKTEEQNRLDFERRQKYKEELRQAEATVARQITLDKVVDNHLESFKFFQRLTLAVATVAAIATVIILLLTF